MTATTVVEQPTVATEDRQPADTGVTPTAPRHGRLRRFLRALRTTIVVLALVAAAVAGGGYLIQQRLAAQAFVEIGPAVLTAEPVLVGSADAGVVTETLVTEQTTVSSGQPLARLRLTLTGVSDRAEVQVLRAPTAGTVSAVNVDTGGVARAGEPVVTLYDPTKVTFQADVPLETLRELRLGMTATITGPGLAAPVTATLEKVLPKVGATELRDGDQLTVVLVPAKDQVATVGTLVPGLQLDAVVDTNTAPGQTPAVNSA